MAMILRSHVRQSRVQTEFLYHHLHFACLLFLWPKNNNIAAKWFSFLVERLMFERLRFPFFVVVVVQVCFLWRARNLKWLTFCNFRSLSRRLYWGQNIQLTRSHFIFQPAAIEYANCNVALFFWSSTAKNWKMSYTKSFKWATAGTFIEFERKMTS